MNQNLGRQWDQPKKKKGPSPEEVRQMKEYHATLKPLKNTLRENGYSYGEVIGWAKRHPNFANSTKRSLASDVAATHDKDPDAFMSMLHHELP
jgi:hypothetical protein